MHLKMNSPAVAHHGKTVIGFNWIAGKEVEGDLPSFDSKSPVDSRDTVGIFPECGARDVERASRAAAAAQKHWGALPATARAAMVGRIGEGLARHREKLAAILTREVGKTPREAMAEVLAAIDTCTHFQAEGQRLLDAAAGPERAAYRRPLGVAGLLSGNARPLAAPAAMLIPAILAGDTVVWKPSEDAPTIAYLFIRCMMDANLPAGVVNVVNGKRAAGCGKHFLAGIDKGFYQKFSFSGSTALGRLVGEMAGRNLLAPSFELGGRNAMIVMPDADLDAAVRAAMEDAFGCAGQRRTALANVILHPDVAEAFKARLLAAVDALTVGNPVTDPEVSYGPMINAGIAKAFEEHWELGREEGAGLLRGGGRWTEENRTGQVQGFVGKGHYLQPCVWDQVTPAMRLFSEELYGPGVNLCVADDFDQALEWANGTGPAPSGSLFTENRRWIARYKRDINAGLVAINDAVTGARVNADRTIDGYTRWQGVFDAGPREADDPGHGAGPHYEASHWDRL
jgi:aldehyde dehydrogenase (NAD+)